MATMEERDDRGRKTAKRDDDGREKDKAQLLSLQQWKRERHTGPLLSIKKKGGGRGGKLRRHCTATPKSTYLQRACDTADHQDFLNRICKIVCNMR